MTRFLTSALFIFLLIQASGQSVRIGILTGYQVTRAAFTSYNGGHYIYGDTTLLDSIEGNRFIETELVSGKVALKINTVSKGKFRSVRIVARKQEGAFTVTSKSPAVRERRYQDAAEVIVNKGK